MLVRSRSISSRRWITILILFCAATSLELPLSAQDELPMVGIPDPHNPDTQNSQNSQLFLPLIQNTQQTEIEQAPPSEFALQNAHQMADALSISIEELEASADPLAGVQVAVAAVRPAHEVGTWSEIQTWPIVPIHAALLTNGKVLAWDSIGDLPSSEYPLHTTTRVALWDPVTNVITRLDNNTGYSLFCAGFATMMDGRLLIAGGNKNAQLAGINKTHLFSPASTSWALGPDMAVERWYPSVTPLANGEMLITSGGPDLAEVFTTAGGIRPLSNARRSLALYPWVMQAPNGNVFSAGPESTMRYLNPTGLGEWQTLGQRDSINRDYGSFAMFDVGKILVSGGGQATNSSNVINLASTVSISNTSSMAFGRRQHNLTILADGTVLATGGLSSQAEHVDLTAGVYEAEVWNPISSAWTTLAAMQVTRQYHSVALLLPDGRLWSAGGGLCGACQAVGYLRKDAEIFSPPYLYKRDGSGQLATRPIISTAPGIITYTQPFTITTPNADAISKISFIRLGSVTHSVNFEQRYLPLAFTRNGQSLTILPPAHVNLAPPGFYMLFLIDNLGVPSVASIIRLQANGGGLSGLYYNNLTMTGLPALQRSEAINFSWGSGSPGSGVNADNFSVRWSGKLQIQTSGSYQFQTVSNDGVRLWVNGQLLINNWNDHISTTDTSPAIELLAGTRYEIKLEYYDRSGGAVIQWLWKPPGAATFAPVPIQHLYPNETVTTATRIWIEAESGVFSSPLQLLSDGSASNGQKIAVIQGNNSLNNPPISGIARYSFSATAPGTYKVSARTIAPTADDNSFWVQIDGGIWYKWNSIATSANWNWDDVRNTDGGNALVLWALSAGSHTLQFAYREDGAWLDRLLLTNDLSFIPNGVSGN